MKKMFWWFIAIILLIGVVIYLTIYSLKITGKTVVDCNNQLLTKDECINYEQNIKNICGKDFYDGACWQYFAQICGNKLCESGETFLKCPDDCSK